MTSGLIDKYIQQRQFHAGAGDAVLRDSGVSVWILIEAYKATGGDADAVARAWDIPQEAVEAALAYYSQHAAAIDDRIGAQRASFS
jgi:uncharacterized protein (DUF433 family)